MQLVFGNLELFGNLEMTVRCEPGVHERNEPNQCQTNQ